MDSNKLVASIFVIGVLGLVIAFIIGIFFVYSLLAPPIKESVGDITNEIVISTNNMGDDNLTQSVQTPIRTTNNIFSILDWLGILCLFVLFIGFLILCSIVDTYPSLAWMWLIVVVLLGILGLYVQQAYIDLTYDNSDYQINKWQDGINRHIGIILIAFGVIGGVILFALQKSESYSSSGVYI